MIIDAMDILYTGKVRRLRAGQSSDSDFTRLAIRLREAGDEGLRHGGEEDPQALHRGLRQVCVYRVSLKAAEAAVPAPKSSGKKKAAAHAEPEPEPKPLTVQALIAQSVEDLADEDGYAYLGDVGTLLLKKQPDFDSRNYGFSKLSRFIASLDCFEIDERRNANYGGTQVFLRNKK